MKVLPLVSRHLSHLNERFLPSSSPPLSPKERLPVSPQTKWDSSGGVLKKTFRFEDDKKRYEFVIGLMGIESESGHHAKILIEENAVTVELFTRDVDQITELDREYARSCDTLFKEVMLHDELR
jgi:pterin-4a-carbinolamine dehydratase